MAANCSLCSIRQLGLDPVFGSIAACLWNMLLDLGEDGPKAPSEEFVPDPVIEKMSRRDLSVFGYGHCAYDARIDHTRHVRLFEFGNLAGRLASLDNIVQVWTDKANLAEGNFEHPSHSCKLT